MPETVVSSLESLYTSSIDARRGYEEALKDAEGRGLTPLFRDMIAVHRQNGDELAASLRAQDKKVDDDGSLMSTVHRAIMSFRSLFNGLDESVLPGLIDGEERNVSHYNEALKEDQLSPETAAMLVQQRDRLDAAILRMKAAKS
jgi:uncharacterized protein (TIGR02284 family)